MPIVRVIIEVDGKVSANYHFGMLNDQESQELNADLKAKLKKIQERN